jgi:hypothetical protein
VHLRVPAALALSLLATGCNSAPVTDAGSDAITDVAPHDAPASDTTDAIPPRDGADCYRGAGLFSDGGFNAEDCGVCTSDGLNCTYDCPSGQWAWLC